MYIDYGLSTRKGKEIGLGFRITRHFQMQHCGALINYYKLRILFICFYFEIEL